MTVTIQKPFNGVSYYQASQRGPLRPIIVESESYADVFQQVLLQICEQGKEIAERELSAAQ